MTVSWNLVSPALKTAGYCVFALDLVRRGMAPIDRSADKLAAFIDEVRTRTGAPTVSIVGHSQGGMLGPLRGQVPRQAGGDRRHRRPRAVEPRDDEPAGARRGPGLPGLRGAGRRLGVHAASSTRRRRRRRRRPTRSCQPATTQVVTPYTSQALAGATNVVLQDRCPEDVTDHVGIIYDPIALQWAMNALERPGPADPAFVPLCSDAAPSPPAVRLRRSPARALVRRRRRRAGRRASATVGRCAGRLMVRDRARRLGSAPVDLAPARRGRSTCRYDERRAGAPRPPSPRSSRAASSGHHCRYGGARTAEFWRASRRSRV